MENPFVPRFVENIDKEAESFLTYYQCEDAIETPRPIPIEDIAKRLMSLDVITTESLSSDESVQGAIAFSSGIVDVYDWDTKLYIGYEVKQPSVFIDTDIINLGRFNNTLAHECYHWWKHRNYFNFERTQRNSHQFGIRCEARAKPSENGDSQSVVERMEWQARNIAPKILMPRTATAKKIESLFEEFVPDGDRVTRKEFTEVVILHLANFFVVSRQSAAIRMVELGYEDAEPFCSLRDSDVPFFGRKKRERSKAGQRQQQISPEDAFRLYCENEFLRATLDTGAFCYADGYFVLRQNRFVTGDDVGQAHLSAYAKSNLHLCTLDFSVRLVEKSSSARESSFVMFRSDADFEKQNGFESNPQNTEMFNAAKAFEREFQQAKEESRTANEVLWGRMVKAQWDQSIFEHKTELDEVHYRRVQDKNHKFGMRPLVAMGVGLELTLAKMTEVLGLAGYTFSPTNREHAAFQYLFSAFYGKPIAVCNTFLESVGIKKLGTTQRK